MSYLNQNIKYLRKNKGYTQSDLAERLGVTRSIIGAYEEQRAEPKIETIQKLAYLFELSLEQLINQDLSNGIDTPRVDEKGKTLRILPIVIDQNDQEQISVVPVSARAGYTHGYSDPDYIRELPKFTLPLPELYSGKSYRLFQIEGDSMLPIPDGSYVIGEYVENWQNIKEGESHVLITHSHGLVYKRIWREGDNLLLKSDNMLYDPYHLPVDELIEVWRGLAYISFSLPGPEHKNESDMKQLSQIVMQLKSDVEALKGKN
jgi:transcriptional regulator with XRE-family HTH domain